MVRRKKVLTPEECLAAALVPEDEQPYQVPDNWCWVRIGAINSYMSGSIDPRMYPDNIFELYSVPSSDNDYPELVKGKEIGSTKQIVERGDVLLCKINPRINRVWKVSAHTDNQSIASSEWVVVRSNAYDADFLMRCFSTPFFREQLLSHVSGVGGSLMRAQPRYIKDYCIPLPPLPEQRRIVDRVESLFAKLDEAEERLKSVITDSEKRQAAVLHAAFNGDLTAKWRDKQGLQYVEWRQVAYKDLGSSRLGKMLDRAKNHGAPTPYLRNVNVRWFGFDLSDIAMMLISHDEAETYSVRSGDLFICEGGEPGRCAVWKDGPSDFVFQKALHRFRANEQVLSDFIAYDLFYLSKSDELSRHFTGTTIKHLTGKALAQIQISLPTIEEQREIVKCLDSLFEHETEVLEATRVTLARARELKSIILAKAMCGELGTNDSAEESAESQLASILARS